MYTYEIKSLQLDNPSMSLHTLTDLEFEWVGLEIQSEQGLTDSELRYLVQDDINSELEKRSYPGIEVTRCRFVVTSSPELQLTAA